MGAAFVGLIGAVCGGLLSQFAPLTSGGPYYSGPLSEQRLNTLPAYVLLFGLFGMVVGGGFARYFRKDPKVRLVASVVLVVFVLVVLVVAAGVESYRIDQVRNKPDGVIQKGH